MSSIEKAIERLNKKAPAASDTATHTQHDSAPGVPLPKPQVYAEAHQAGIVADGKNDVASAPAVFDGDKADDREVFKINLSYLEQHGYLTTKTERSALAEEYRRIKRPLLMNALGKGASSIDLGNLIMVTSALPGEGKTFTSINLSMSMALELDSTILVVDSDVIRASLSKELGLDHRPGLTDLLLDPGLDIGDVIIKTDIPRLRILPAGSSHSHSTELLASDAMRRITKELAERYHDRVVLFDAPPLLATSEASVIASLVGQLVVVVAAGDTPRHAIKDAIAQIDSNKVIGTVLNKSRRVSGGGYYDGYYDGYYGEDRE